MIFEMCKNLEKLDILSLERCPTAIFGSARRNVRGRRGGKEGLKPLQVWQGSWARHLEPGIWGLEIWDLSKPDRNWVSPSSTPGTPKGGRRIAYAHSAGPRFLGKWFVGLWGCGLWFVGFLFCWLAGLWFVCFLKEASENWCLNSAQKRGINH